MSLPDPNPPPPQTNKQKTVNSTDSSSHQLTLLPMMWGLKALLGSETYLFPGCICGMWFYLESQIPLGRYMSCMDCKLCS